jgi:hypothetical protein
MEVENAPLEFPARSEGRFESTLICGRAGLGSAVLAGIEFRVESVVAEVALDVDQLAALSCLACCSARAGAVCFISVSRRLELDGPRSTGGADRVMRGEDSRE